MKEFYKNKRNKDGHHYECKVCFDLYNKTLQRRSEINKWRKEHRERNKEREKQKNSIYIKNRRKTDIGWRLAKIISKHIWQGINDKGYKKTKKTWNIIKYTPQQLKEHLENQWEPWMSWHNYGPASSKNKTWQIDHIIPRSNFNFIDEKQIIKCWSLENLQPLESIKNIKKGNKI